MGVNKLFKFSQDCFFQPLRQCPIWPTQIFNFRCIAALLFPPDIAKHNRSSRPLLKDGHDPIDLKGRSEKGYGSSGIGFPTFHLVTLGNQNSSLLEGRKGQEKTVWFTGINDPCPHASRPFSALLSESLSLELGDNGNRIAKKGQEPREKLHSAEMGGYQNHPFVSDKKAVQASLAGNMNSLQKIAFPLTLSSAGKKEFLEIVTKDPSKG